MRGLPQGRGCVQVGTEAGEQELRKAGWSVNIASQGGGRSSLVPSRWARMSVTAAMSSSGSMAVAAGRGKGRGLVRAQALPAQPCLSPVTVIGRKQGPDLSGDGIILQEQPLTGTSRGHGL